ncbi:hypothetical protein SNOUR_43530 [Streptomyces noursei ATCC 11455]|nr:hypothetical protein SNOUR_00420 [Streptomyces noursei ATCC 11455]ANZ21928.1 hypothetical protein SNOUR_43530 [Streptomyces noursei ATCC 11455]
MTTPPAHPNPNDPMHNAPTRMQPHAPTEPAPAWWSVAPHCRVCGAQPAAHVSVRAHQGVIMLMRFHTQNGLYCRTCGTAVIRVLTTLTLYQGWWSPLSLVAFTPATLIANVFAHRKIAALPPPGPTAPGATPMQQGKPIHRRPLAYIAVVPLAWAAWFIPNIIAHL